MSSLVIILCIICAEWRLIWISVKEYSKDCVYSYFTGNNCSAYYWCCFSHKSVNANRGGNNNIVNLNETEENVAIKTEDITDEIDELGTEEILQEANARGRMAEDSDISATESTTVAAKADKENVTEEPTVPPTMSSEEVMAEGYEELFF